MQKDDLKLIAEAYDTVDENRRYPAWTPESQARREKEDAEREESQKQYDIEKSKPKDIDSSTDSLDIMINNILTKIDQDKDVHNDLYDLAKRAYERGNSNTASSWALAQGQSGSRWTDEWGMKY